MNLSHKLLRVGVSISILHMMGYGPSLLPSYPHVILELLAGIEPTTCSLQVSCTANCAIEAFFASCRPDQDPSGHLSCTNVVKTNIRLCFSEVIFLVLARIQQIICVGADGIEPSCDQLNFLPRIRRRLYTPNSICSQHVKDLISSFKIPKGKYIS